MTDDATPKSSDNTRESNVDRRNTSQDWYDVLPLSPAEHIACVVPPSDTGIGVVNAPIEKRTDPRQPAWSYDGNRDELVVSAQYENPLQYGACIARALTCDWTWDTVLTTERLADDIVGWDGLDDFPAAVLRNARCVGYLQDADHDPVSYTTAIKDARDDFLALTQRLRYVDGDKERELRSRILREAHGLVGTMTHLFDLVGVSVTRELRVPYYRRDFHSDGHDNRRRTDLLRFLQTALPIGSRYGHYSAQRVLFERRDEKRHSLLGSPSTDGAFARGSLIGQWTIVGRGVDQLVSHLWSALREPNELQQDSENFCDFRVDVRIESDWTRPKAREAIDRMAAQRGYSVTDEVANVLCAFLRSVYSICTALSALPRETGTEVELSVDTCLFAMSTLDPSRIIPEATPTQSRIVHALMGAEDPLSQAELSRRTDMSGQSIRNNRDQLFAFDIVNRVNGKYVLGVTQDGDNAPVYLQEKMELHEVLWNVVAELCGGDDRLRDVTDDVGAAFYWPQCLAPLLEEWPWMDPFIRCIGAFTREDFFSRSTDRGQMSVPLATMTSFGNSPVK